MHIETRLIKMVHTLNMFKHKFAVLNGMIPDLPRVSIETIQLA